MLGGMDRTPTLERSAPPASATGGRLASLEIAVTAGFMAPLHAHQANEEVQVLEGRITVYAGDEAAPLGPGDRFVVPESVLHTYRVDSTQARAVFTTFTASAARYEGFLRATGPAAPGRRWSTEEDAATVRAVSTAAEIAVFGPPGMLPPDLHEPHAA
jgi:quercetin dioxygenase-like cupin family protein